MYDKNQLTKSHNCFLSEIVQFALYIMLGIILEHVCPISKFFFYGSRQVFLLTFMKSSWPFWNLNCFYASCCTIISMITGVPHDGSQRPWSRFHTTHPGQAGLWTSALHRLVHGMGQQILPGQYLWQWLKWVPPPPLFPFKYSQTCLLMPPKLNI